MSSLDRYATDKLAQLDARQLRRRLVATSRSAGGIAERDGRRLISFACNDYLNLSTDPAVKAAAIAAVERFGAGAGASRLVTGNYPLLDQLEGRLAALKGTAAACVFGSGYLANMGLIPCFAGADDLILVDELAHACIHAGAALSAGTVIRFRHNDLTHLEALLHKHRAGHPNCLVVTDGVFSMDGDLAPVVPMGDLCAGHDAWLMTDDAHGIGVLAAGRGSTYAGATPARVPLQMGTLSKAIGSYGGYLCASQPVIDLVKTRARTLIYSTGLPPAAAGAALAALDIIEQDPARVARPVALARQFTDRLGLAPAASPIVPIILGEAGLALAASAQLAAENYLVTAIRPPTVPQGTARLRFAFTAAHHPDDVAAVAAFLAQRIL